MIKRKTNRTIALLITGIFCLLITNKAIFLHSHKLNDGKTITHAHPYDTSNDTKPLKAHSHSFLISVLLHITDILFYTNIIGVMLLGMHFLTTFIQRYLDYRSIEFRFSLNGRSPPLQISK